MSVAILLFNTAKKFIWKFTNVYNDEYAVEKNLEMIIAILLFLRG